MSRPQVPIIPVPALIEAYAQGRFPMCHDDGELYWHDPDPRAVFPLGSIQPNARLRRALRKCNFSISMDRDLESVIRGCADREETWIDQRVIGSYIALHKAGYVHSVEVTTDQKLVGGIYGVALGGAFFGESMFSRRSHAGKAAFFALVQHLNAKGFVLFDSQYINAFTEQLGAVEIPRSEFRSRLQQA
ncbi:MAG: leucyl/phenylalanyl-tRNA--protein transferase, partial [Flavobacteriales bacterium]|nr:leucyl/phenylalanyl-tRNA--protein transferase [Flavobacteriales bacterium]